ncbi:MAG: site-specific DNA-methyltransferase [Actinomycetota bacterium]|nr:site-specific DNA-methyltransferase [Actinomycetota bacterium]
MTPRNVVIEGDALDTLAVLGAESVDCVVTSPPYYQLRDYGMAGQLGMEPTVDDWVECLRAVAREVHRVLVPWGAFFLNLGDSYSRHGRYGAPAKSLLLGPERVAQALLGDGWLVRNTLVWRKTNPVPSPVSDRFSPAHEFLYLLVKQQRFFFDLDAVREPARSHRPPRPGTTTPASVLGALAGGSRHGLAAMKREGRSAHPLGKNPGTVWEAGTAAPRVPHFATFPPALVRRPILAGCPAKVCTGCGQPWQRSTERVRLVNGVPAPRPLVPCACQAPTRPGLVLDPFFGTGTVGVVARRYGRDWLGIELNPDYVRLARGQLGAGLVAGPAR